MGDEVVHLCLYLSIAAFPFMEDQSLLDIYKYTPQCMLLVFEPEQEMKLIYSFNQPLNTRDVSFDIWLICLVCLCVCMM